MDKDITPKGKEGTMETRRNCGEIQRLSRESMKKRNVKEMEKNTGTERQTDRQSLETGETDRETDRKTDRQPEGQNGDKIKAKRIKHEEKKGKGNGKEQQNRLSDKQIHRHS